VQGFDKFREFVLSDPASQTLLRDELDTKAFISKAVELGRQHGFNFSADEVRDALDSSIRAWNERWIELR
jgi:hypothetical protein